MLQPEQHPKSFPELVELVEALYLDAYGTLELDTRGSWRAILAVRRALRKGGLGAALLELENSLNPDEPACR